MRYWSILFALAAIGTVAAFVYCVLLPGLVAARTSGDDPHHVISTFGREIDSLFLIILLITGIVFIGTQIVLVWAMYRFADERDAQGRPVRKADYFHGSQRLEVIWTIIPAAILVFIALYQMGTWAEIKFRSTAPKVPPLAEITARQFQWVMRYPGPDGKLNTRDDLVIVNDLHFVKNKQALIYLKSSDVLHSFFLPQLRIKQDAVPGPDDPGLVRRRHGRGVRAGLRRAVRLGPLQDARQGHGPRDRIEQFQKWIDEKLAEQNRSQLTMATGSQGR